MDWTTLVSTDEMEVTSGSTLTFEVEGGLEIATDCQLEFGHKTSLVFKPFESNFATLLVRTRQSHPTANQGHLIVKKYFGHLEAAQSIPVTTLDLDLRDPIEITSLPDLEQHLDQDDAAADAADDDLAAHDDYEDVPNPDVEPKSPTLIEDSPRLEKIRSPDSGVPKTDHPEETKINGKVEVTSVTSDDDEDDDKNVIQVKEYSPTKADDDVIFIQLTS
jgi:hypothetical protein